MTTLNPPDLIIGDKYINKTQIKIIQIDYSEVIKNNSVNLQNSINLVTSNGYIVTKNENVIKNVSQFNYVISPSGMKDGEYCGTDNQKNYVFKMSYNTAINIDKQTEILPIGAKITFVNGTNSRMFQPSNDIIKTNTKDELFNNVGNKVNKVANFVGDTANKIINSQNVIGGRKLNKKIKTKN